MPIRHHIFFSYAHVDNRDLPGRELPYMDAFVEALKIQLATYAGRKDAIVMWHDSRLRSNDRFSPEILEGVKSSALFLAMLSPGYLDPASWCAKELAAFQEAQPLPGNVGRMFGVMLSDLRSSQLPPGIKGTSPIPFFRKTAGDRGVLPLDPPGWPGESPDTMERISDLAHDLWDALTELAAAGAELPNNRPPKAGGAAPAVAAAKPTVYVGDVTDDLLEARTAIVNALAAEGFQVKPEGELPGDAAALARSVEESAQASIGSLLLYGPLAGRKPAGTAASRVQMQGEQILKMGGGKPVIWVAPEVKIENVGDEAYRAFLKSLLHSREGQSFELWQTDLVALKREFVDRLKKRLQPAAPADTVNGDRSVYVSYRGSEDFDGNRIEALCDQFQKRSCTVTVLDHSQTERAQKLHQRFVDLSDGMVIVYSPRTQDWAEELAFEADYAARSRQNRLRRLGILGAPPAPFAVRSNRIMELAVDAAGQFGGVDDFLKGLAA